MVLHFNSRRSNASDVHNDSRYIGTDTNTMSIQNAKKCDEGCYRCLQRNDMKMDGIYSQRRLRLSVCKLLCTYSEWQGIGIWDVKQKHSIHIHSAEAIPIQLTLF